MIGDPDRDDVHEIATEVGAKLRREIQVVFRSPKAWKSTDDGFGATVRARPLVPLDLGDRA